MTLKSMLAMVLAGMMCVSCGGNQPAGSQQAKSSGKTLAGAADTTRAKPRASDQTAVRIPEAPIGGTTPAAAPGGLPAQASAGTGAANAGKSGADLSDVPPAPRDARWTIFCASVRDASHVETARGLKAALLKRTNLREWYILHESGESRIYYGYYRSINEPNDAAESKRAQEDRKKIEALVDGGGEQPFKRSHFVQLSAPDPDSPPEWNLVNVPEGKVWTLIIGAYKDHPDRKKFAVDAVRDARAAGEEAYYFHGENVSNVCIGAWPENAMIEQRVDAKEGVNVQKDPILVLPPGMKASGKVSNNDGRVRAVGQSLVPTDRTLLAKIEQYPNMGVNGEFLVYKDKTKGKTRMQGSIVQRIPRPSDTLFRENVANAANGDVNAPANDPYGEIDAARAGSPRQSDAQQGDGSTTGGPSAGRLRSVGRR